MILEFIGVFSCIFGLVDWGRSVTEGYPLTLKFVTGCVGDAAGMREGCEGDGTGGCVGDAREPSSPGPAEVGIGEAGVWYVLSVVSGVENGADHESVVGFSRSLL